VTTATRTSAQLLSELIAEALRPSAGAVGVVVRDVLSPDPKTLLERLKAMHEDEGFSELRIAYLRPGGAEAAAEVGLGDDVFSTEIEQAERWRNELDLEALIVVVARGDEAKLSSLEDFGTVTSQDLKRVLVERAMGGPAGENDVQTLLWEMLAKDDAVGLGQLVDYYLSLEGKDGAEFKAASSRELHRLGLLPDPTLFDNPKAAAMQKRLLSNREVVERLQMLTPKDRRTIKQVVEGETDPAEKTKLREALDQLHRTRSAGGATGAIDYEHAERLIKARTKKPPPTNGKPARPSTERSADVASDALIDPKRVEDVKELLHNLRETLENADETSVRTEKVRTQLSESSTEAFTTVRLDVMNLVAKLLDDGVYGGLVQVDLDDIDDLLRRFNVQEHVIARWERDDIGQVLDHIAQASEGGGVIATRFDAYDKARTKILPYLRALTSEPLVVAADPETRKALLAAVAAYEDLANGLREHYDEIFEAVGSDVDELVGLLLLMDIIVIKGGDRLFALLSPVHPLFVWHYATYAELVEAQRDRLDQRDKKLVADAARRLPNFLTSLYVPAAAVGNGNSLTYAGRLGQLPYYSDDVESSSSDDGVDAIVDLLTGYLALEPHARAGFRVALVDPPDAGAYLRAMVDLRDAGALEGAHVVVYRHQTTRLAVELRLDEDDEDRVAQVFRALNMDRRFTFEVRDLPPEEVGPADDEPFHVAVVFDRSGGRTTRARPAAHPIQPLAMPRRIHYSTVHQTVELEPAPGGLFESYYKVVGRIAEGSGQAAYLAVHQEKELRDALDALAQRVAWTAIADRQVDRDLTIGSLRIFTATDGERDVAAFARTTAAFRRPLREVARHYNTFITDEELDDLLRQLSDLLDFGLLNVKPDHTGKTNESRIKGLLATLIAARWYRKDAPSGSRLLVSLDSQEARRWMHLSDDPLRADLVGFEWTDGHCTVTVIEVKSVEATASEYKIDNGVVSGPAVNQMLATRRLLAAVLTENHEGELITTPARREVLREHLYRELTKGAYPPEERKLWADRLQRLLDGEVKADVGCHLIDVRLGVDASTLQDRTVVAEDGEESVPTRVRELNEELLDALNAPAEPPEEAGPGGGETPPPEEPRGPKPVGGDGAAPSEPKPTEPTPPTDAQPAEAAGEAREREAAPARETAPIPTEPEAAPRPRALLGTAPGTYGKPREVWFDPNLPGQKLPNPHISITGETGSGKTQATKAIVSDLQAQGLPALILDFKDDYSDSSFVATEDFRLYDASYSPLPFNPLTPAIDKRQDLINPSHHIHQVADIIKRIYKLGDQQAFRLREAIKRAYEGAGISLRPAPLDPGKPFPPFEVVQRELVDDKANEPLLGRLSPIFDLGLFATDAEQANFEEFLRASAVIRLGQLPSDEVKNSVAEFFLMALYNYLIRQTQTHTLGRVLVLDEAWRVVESPFLTPLMREGRAFGLGVIIASQFPRDLPEAVRGSTATRLFFSQGQVEQIREIQRTIVGKTSGPEADHISSVVRGLTPLSCVLHSTQYTPFVRVSILPYFQRRAIPE
jgi:Helicase HerA, central domain